MLKSAWEELNYGWKKKKKKNLKKKKKDINIINNSIKKVFYSVIYSIFIFILSLTTFVIIVIVLEINMNYINIFCSLWMYNTGTNIYIICILDGYTKDRDIGPDNYVAADKKSVKVDLYGMSIIIIDTLNGLDIIIFADIIYYSTFLANIISTKYFQFKKVYLDKKHNQLYKKKVI